jgi:hypothetical protein
MTACCVSPLFSIFYKILSASGARRTRAFAVWTLIGPAPRLARGRVRVCGWGWVRVTHVHARIGYGL